jgi:4,5-DOPA dioxygenase extradiol
VAIVGSGSLTHNLYKFRQNAKNDEAYAQEFTRWVRNAIVNRDARASSNIGVRRRMHSVRITEEHFLPLPVALGSSDDADGIDILEGGVTYGVLSMESYAWGAPLSAH